MLANNLRDTATSRFAEGDDDKFAMTRRGERGREEVAEWATYISEVISATGGCERRGVGGRGPRLLPSTEVFRASLLLWAVGERKSSRAGGRKLWLSSPGFWWSC